MTSQWRHRNKPHSWYSELNCLQNVYFGFFIFGKLIEWRCFVTYLWNDPRINATHWLTIVVKEYVIWCDKVCNVCYSMPVDGYHNNIILLLFDSITSYLLLKYLIINASKKSWDSQDFCPDQDQDFFLKTKTLFFVLEAPRDQDLGFKDYITVIYPQSSTYWELVQWKRRWLISQGDIPSKCTGLAPCVC